MSKTKDDEISDFRAWCDPKIHDCQNIFSESGQPKSKDETEPDENDANENGFWFDIGWPWEWGKTEETDGTDRVKKLTAPVGTDRGVGIDYDNQALRKESRMVGALGTLLVLGLIYYGYSRYTTPSQPAPAR